MARKKSRSLRSPREGRSAGSETAVAPPPAVTGVTPTEPAVSLPPASVKNVSVKKEEFWLAVLLHRAMRLLGSLQLAVILLSIFAVVLAIGTVVESWYSGKLAQELVYRSWWFGLLIVLLGINIFFAAAKKWPWKRYQTGFLITHLGLLFLVAGGIVNFFGGTDSLLPLIDTDDPEQQAQAGGVTQESSTMMDRDTAQIAVQWSAKGEQKEKGSQVYPFNPGSLPWRADKYTAAHMDALPAVLNVLAHPLGRSWEAELPTGVTLEVLGYYPYCRRGRYRAADKDSYHTFPAVKFALSSPMAGSLPDQWVAYATRGRVAQQGPSLVEFLGICPPGMLDEFLHPPGTDQLLPSGQLVLSLNGETVRLNVDAAMNHSQPLGKTGWQVKITRYSPDPQANAANADPIYPVVAFELSRGDKTIQFGAASRDPGPPQPVEEKALPDDLRDLQVWLHPPDFQMGQKNIKAMLQFIKGEDGQLYYRSFDSTGKPAFSFEKSGSAARGDTLPIWTGMAFKVQITDYLPRAVHEEPLVPEDLRPGSEREGYEPAIRCRLSKGGKTSDEVWLSQTIGGLRKVSFDNEDYQIGFQYRTQDLGFQVKLLRAEQTNDPSSQQAATYASYVLLNDKAEGIENENHAISMNAPLYHNHYKLYQSGYQLIDIDPSGKPISRSTFTVGYDPGILLKYLGQIMLGLGIFTMFYMRAYFFKPRGKKVVALAADAGDVPEEV